MKSYRRALGEGAAGRCENAKTPRCKCRCGGKFHGAARLRASGAPPTLFDLPEDDPHHPKFRGEAEVVLGDAAS